MLTDYRAEHQKGKSQEGIDLSQFLICKSEHQLTRYGVKFEDLQTNKDLYMQVIDKYMHHDDVKKIWVVDKIHDMVDDLTNNLNSIEEICQKSEEMVFWYGTDFEELDKISSRYQFMNYLKQNINNPCPELYLYVHCKEK